MLTAAIRRAAQPSTRALVQRHMSTSPNMLAMLYPKPEALHIDQKSANRQFNKALQKTEQTARQEMEQEESFAHQMLFDSFEQARRSGVRASALIRVGRLAEAEKQALTSLRHARGIEIDMGAGLALDALRSLVELYTAQSRLRDAEPFARELVDRMTQLLGPKHPQTLKPMQSLATMMASDGRFRQAAALLQTVHDHCVEIYGGSHPATQQVASRLRSALSEDADGFDTDRVWLERFFAGDRGAESGTAAIM